MRLPGIGSHHSARSITDEWLTPPHVLEALGPFDLDPCSPPESERPRPTATHHLSIDDDGLTATWEGRVWLNPPYSQVEPWMERLAEHDRGTALVFARLETRWWFEHVWPKASAILFLKGRLSFIRLGDHGEGAGHNAGGPSALIAYGPDDADRLFSCDLPGARTRSWMVQL